MDEKAIRAVAEEEARWIEETFETPALSETQIQLIESRFRAQVERERERCLEELVQYEADITGRWNKMYDRIRQGGK